jgi:hypothetical protein
MRRHHHGNDNSGANDSKRGITPQSFDVACMNPWKKASKLERACLKLGWTCLSDPPSFLLVCGDSFNAVHLQKLRHQIAAQMDLGGIRLTSVELERAWALIS